MASPPVASTGFSLQSGTGSLMSGTGELGSMTGEKEEKDTRMVNKMIGPLAGIPASRDGDVERDAYGQPLSPTNMLTGGKGPFDKLHSETPGASKRTQHLR